MVVNARDDFLHQDLLGSFVFCFKFIGSCEFIPSKMIENANYENFRSFYEFFLFQSRNLSFSSYFDTSFKFIIHNLINIVSFHVIYLISFIIVLICVNLYASLR